MPLPLVIDQGGLAIAFILVTTMLVMAHGGYRFGDHWRLGLPLSCIVAGLGIRLIVLTWPL
jgi:di/tricarboxylate transporter